MYSGFGSGSPKKLDERLVPGDHKEGVGWKVTDDKPVTLVARIGQEKKQEIGIRDMDGGNAVRQVTLVPFFAELLFPPRLPNQQVTKLVGSSLFEDGRWK